jgi:hypothetical protein
MENYILVLELFYVKLKEVFLLKEKKEFSLNSDLDLLSLIVGLRRKDKDLRDLLEESCISLSELIFKIDKRHLIDSAILEGLIKSTQSSYSKSYQITFLGLYRYLIESDSSFKIENVLKAIENYRLPVNKLSLKTPEKLICLFLIIVGADSKVNSLKLHSPRFNKNCFDFLRVIDEKCFEIGLELGTRITFFKGKNSSFIGVLGNNDHLSKTPVYKGSTQQGFYLDFETPGNINYIIDLLLGEISELEKLKKKNLINELIFQMKQRAFEILEEVTPDVNSKFIENLNA